mgnify:FL=1
MSYLLTDNSAPPLLIFLGFGQSSEKQQHLFELFPENRVLIIDPLLFGESDYIGIKKSISTDDLNSVFQELFLKENIQESGILAYSLGARFAMNLCLLYPDSISSIHLLAPDGIILNFWNRAIAHSLLIQKAYTSLMHNQKILLGLLRLGQGLRLLRPSLVKFARLHTKNKEAQERVLRLWILLKDVQPNFQSFIRTAKAKSIPLNFVFGKYDRVITHRVRKKAMRCSPESEFTLLEAGHDLMKHEVLEQWLESRTS